MGFNFIHLSWIINIMEFIIAITVLVATVIGSISGIGGGVIIKPVMDAICSMPANVISFLSGTTVLTMTIVSLIRSYMSGTHVDKRGVPLAIGGAVGGLLGKLLFDFSVRSVPSKSVSLIQNIIMVILTVLVLVYHINKDRINKKDYHSYAVTLSLGALLGIFSSFLGIGGGPINIMILSYFFSMDSKTTALCSLFIIFFSQLVSLLRSTFTGTIPEFQVSLLVLMMICAVIGANVGRYFSKRMDNKAVDKLFFIILIVITLISCYNVVRFGFLA